ncbi:hypothetical protein [Micromonospora sp. NPDC050495]|uniref:hypothetical protein n=1 Tax=Micromonospora sp. NPDC050495 TaxID=3154936 RepID=UPI0033D944DD
MSDSREPQDTPPTLPGASRPPAAGATPPGAGPPAAPLGPPPPGTTPPGTGLPGRPAAAPRPGGRGLAVLALGVAGLALLLALGSTIFAWRAIDQAHDAKDIALRPAPGTSAASAPASDAPTAAAPTATGETPTEDVPRSPGEAPPLDERTVYRPRYDKQPLTFKVPCSNRMYADLDEPRVMNESTGAEIKFTMGCGNTPSYFTLQDGVDGSEDASAGMLPPACGDKIRTAPIATGAAIPVRKGTAICVTTDYGNARAHGEPWRMILLEVMGVANDGAATVRVTAWDIPDE